MDVQMQLVLSYKKSVPWKMDTNGNYCGQAMESRLERQVLKIEYCLVCEAQWYHFNCPNQMA